MANQKTISQILATKNKEMNSASKIKAIKKVVTSHKKAYGNEDVKIEETYNNTCNGAAKLKYQSDKDKLASISIEIDKIRCAAIENTESTDGVVIQKEVEKLISINPLLSNLGDSEAPII